VSDPYRVINKAKRKIKEVEEFFASNGKFINNEDYLELTDLLRLLKLTVKKVENQSNAE
jgi:hypothetical protein